MSLYAKWAWWFFVPSALVALVNAWAFRAFPKQWGDPNFGGGAIQVAAYAGMVIGVVFFVLAIVRRRRDRSAR